MENFEESTKKYEPMIHKIMNTLHIYKNKEEFFQLGLIGLWEAQERFDPSKGNFTNYAYTYIKGLFLSEMTKRNKHEERSTYPEEEFWHYIEDPNSEQPLEMDTLLSYCQNLTKNQTKWVLYTVMDGLTTKEIAQKENVSVSAVKAWRQGARKALGEGLAPSRKS